MALASVYKSNLNPSQPWAVQIKADSTQGIKGGRFGFWSTKKKAQAWADEFNRLHPIDFKVGDEVKFYDGDDLNVTYGTITAVKANTCSVQVNGCEQVLTYQIKKNQLNYN